MYLYHYRSVENAILEITNGTFRFSSSNEVNDPMDGYTNLYWKGDISAWEGLLRNYICSLYNIITLILLKIDEKEIEKNTVMPDIHCFDNVTAGKEFEAIGKQFLQHELVKKVIGQYAHSRVEYEDSLVEFLLRLVHGVAMKICVRQLCQNGMLTNDSIDALFPDDSENENTILEWIGGLEDENWKSTINAIHDNTVDIIENKLFLTRRAIKNKTNIDSCTQELQHMWLMVYVDFPTKYVDGLKQMVYPQGYFVCFSKNNDNTVMWGNYADCHKGVCLIYKTNSHNGKEYIPIQIPSSKYNEIEVREIKYDGTPVRQNFFEQLGRHTYDIVKTWLTGLYDVSTCLSVYEDTDTWRINYWKMNEERFYHKLFAWKDEEEYRIFWVDRWNERESSKKRNFRYAADSLVGIIFGEKTSIEDQHKVYSELCKVITKPEVYAAKYDKNGTIIVRRKAILSM